MDGNVTDSKSTSKSSSSNAFDSGIPTREELIQRARDMAPILLERAPNCEEMRRAPKETIDDFKQAGFF
ncbi:MAG TPA: hypothetical protein QF359_06780, partial [Rhodospirillales bacterium]|nr:hypothetical protein [Rhodospirillales bacterium]